MVADRERRLSSSQFLNKREFYADTHTHVHAYVLDGEI